MMTPETAAFHRPPDVPGMACLNSLFGGSGYAAREMAIRMGFEVAERHGSSRFFYVSYEAAARMQELRQRSSEEVAAARVVTKDHVSARILTDYLRWDVNHFAAALGLERIRPVDGEEEYFVRIEDIPAIIGAAREAGREIGPGVEDQVYFWIEDRRLAGISIREAMRRRRAHEGGRRSKGSWPPY